ncbi:unnamed protein product [Peronospora belbahrii]|uniref:Uncharacterized protein n=1 Tax=Peronospora belbahrii TaxID=622444 RepID=A0ABN8CL13_9STRA|nr:unnamed protein product [Peronospora belbahrii]
MVSYLSSNQRNVVTMFINFKDLNVELQGKSFLATIQAILHESDKVSRPMIKFAASVSKESVVDVFVTLNVPNSPVLSTTQKDVELNVEKFFVVSKALPELPFQVEDAARSDIVVKAEESTSVNEGLSIRILKYLAMVSTHTWKSYMNTINVVYGPFAIAGHFFLE